MAFFDVLGPKAKQFFGQNRRHTAPSFFALGEILILANSIGNISAKNMKIRPCMSKIYSK